MATYVALLRGINVGGNNVIPMAALRSAFEDRGFADVATYIQSGNVVFSSPKKRDEACVAVERLIEATFGLSIPVVVRSKAQIVKVVSNAPKGFGTDGALYRSDVIFLKEPMTPREAMKHISTKDGVDRVWTGAGVLYFDRLNAKATQSRLNKIVGTPAYKSMTIRNWNTTRKLSALMSQPGSSA